MKNYVRREWTGSFEEAIISVDKVNELVAISMGVKLQKKEHVETLEFYNRCLKEADNDKDREKYKKEIKSCEEYINMLDDMIINFEVKNEIPIEKYSIKKQKVDYEFDLNISELSDEEILKRLNSIFPNKKLYIVPSFRGNSIKKRVTILGHNGNIVVTYK